MSVKTGILELPKHSYVFFSEASQVEILGLPFVPTSAGTPVLEPHSDRTMGKTQSIGYHLLGRRIGIFAYIVRSFEHC